MRSSIITNSNIKHHKVENYHFRVLSDDGSFQNEHPQPVNDEIALDSGEQQHDISDDISQEDALQVSQNQPQQAQPQQMVNHSANEELFKRIESLSETIVKLQMKLESNEQEFQKRLEVEINTAKENAYSEGKNDAKALYDSEIEKLNDKLLKSVEKLDKKVLELDTFLNKTESELSSSAIDIAQEIIAKELEQNSSNIAYSLSTELIKDIKKDAKIKISVNPKDFRYISERYQADNIKVIPDEAINAGCVMVLSDELNIEANITDRLNKVKNMVLKG